MRRKWPLWAQLVLLGVAVAVIRIAAPHSRVEWLGLAGGVAFMVSGFPSAWKAFREGRGDFIPALTSWTVLLGALLTYAYLFLKNGWDWVIFLDYSATAFTWAVILAYRYFPRKSKEQNG